MTIARSTIIAAAIMAALAMPSGFAVSKTLVVISGPITKSKPGPSTTPHPPVTQNTKPKNVQAVGQTMVGHPH
jgi:hypothetical protein